MERLNFADGLALAKEAVEQRDEARAVACRYYTEALRLEKENDEGWETAVEWMYSSFAAEDEVDRLKAKAQKLEKDYAVVVGQNVREYDLLLSAWADKADLKVRVDELEADLDWRTSADDVVALKAKVQELDAEAGALFDTGLGLSVQYNEDVDALVACLDEILDKNQPRLFLGAKLKLPQHLRERVQWPGEEP